VTPPTSGDRDELDATTSPQIDTDWSLEDKALRCLQELDAKLYRRMQRPPDALMQFLQEL
jgi:hypothetical protein